LEFQQRLKQTSTAEETVALTAGNKSTSAPEALNGQHTGDVVEASPTVISRASGSSMGSAGVGRYSRSSR